MYSITTRAVLLALSTLLSRAGAGAIHTGNAPTVTLRNGSYYGTHNPTYNQDYFLGMPFAQPPVGQLRFVPPEPLNATWTDSHNATEYGPSCVGYGPDTELGAGNYTSEDCLNLNVLRPSGEFAEPLPVAVYIYGGGWTVGSSASSLYNLTFLVERSVQMGRPIIAASMNYRLAFWGWLYSEEWAEQGITNLGMRDQRLALRWIQENIAAFGGDPTKVTIFGESGGAHSVSNHVFAYDGRDDGLFAGAISQSGSPAGFGPWQTTFEKSALVSSNVTATVCPNADDKLACLRQADFETLNNAINASTMVPTTFPQYGPLVDGDIIARSQIEQMKDGAYIKVPYMIGNQHDEAGYYIPEGLNSEDDILSELMSSYIGLNATQAISMLQTYPLLGAEQSSPEVRFDQLNETVGLQYKRGSTILGDLIYNAGVWWSSEEMAKHGGSKIYRYIANTPISVGPRYYGSSHGYELAYMLNNVNGSGWEGGEAPFFGGNPFQGRPQAYLDLAAVMSGMWVGFMNDGVPHYDGQPGPQWPAYTDEDQSVYLFAAQPDHLDVTVGTNHREEQLRQVISQDIYRI